MIFKKVNLGEVTHIRGGKRLPLGEEFSSEITDHPYIRARDIGEGRIQISEPVFLKPETASRLSRYQVREGDICITIVGANVGDVGEVPKHLDGANLTENAVKITQKDNIEQGFIKYALLSKNAASQMKLLAGGAAQPKLGLYKIKTIEIPLPDLHTQNRIVSFLSNYDELILNCEKRVELLEGISKSIYREWFLNYRFPGHQKVSLKNSSSGMIPDGWNVVSIKEMADFISRGPSLTYVEEDSGCPVINQRCVRDGEIEMQAVQYAAPLSEQRSELYLRVNDVLINSMGVGTLGRVSRNLTIVEKTIIHNCITVVRSNPDRHNAAYLYYKLSDSQKYFEGMGIGATGQTSLRIETIADLMVIAPPLNLLIDFDKLILPIWLEIGLLKRQITSLRHSRDLLLPRLLSGRIYLRES
jgi:type I restriction enzyme S subunit